jgi:hypothetical protein
MPDRETSFQNRIKCGVLFQAHETQFSFLLVLAQCWLCHICVLYVTLPRPRNRVLTRHIFPSRNSAVIFK